MGRSAQGHRAQRGTFGSCRGPWPDIPLQSSLRDMMSRVTRDAAVTNEKIKTFCLVKKKFSNASRTDTSICYECVQTLRNDAWRSDPPQHRSQTLCRRGNPAGKPRSPTSQPPRYHIRLYPSVSRQALSIVDRRRCYPHVSRPKSHAQDDSRSHGWYSVSLPFNAVALTGITRLTLNQVDQ